MLELRNKRSFRNVTGPAVSEANVIQRRKLRAKQFADWIYLKFPNLRCPCCQSANFSAMSVLPSEENLELAEIKVTVAGQASWYSCVGCICKNCAYVLMFHQSDVEQGLITSSGMLPAAEAKVVSGGS